MSKRSSPASKPALRTYAVYAVETAAVLLLVYLYVDPSWPWQSPSLPDGPVEKGTLLFVEDLDGQGGLSAGRFGDLVLLNPETGARHVLTRDNHYDDHPSWGPEGRYILFASKRQQNPRTRDMGAPSHIHRLDLTSGEIRLWGKELADRFEIVGSVMEKPAVSPSGNLIGFATYPDAGSSSGRVVIYDRQQDRVRVVADSVFFIDRLTWSEDEQHLGFSAVPQGKAIQDYALFVIDVETGNPSLIVKEDAAMCRLGDLHRGRMLYERMPLTSSRYAFWESTYPEQNQKTEVYSYTGGEEI